ncbi:MAG: hypothetical protein CUN56_06875 [Phototrophicales bacterium]|nr:MAG: hypothetical protein CUN56_06875 [Phototrophicales bacterium]RMG76991.1 MAG: hypothetical protein D6711_02715 [Chloroflexota bacterium]
MMVPEYDQEIELDGVNDWLLTDDDLIQSEGWTWQRAIYLLIALLMIIAMLTVYVLLPLIQSNLPSVPPTTPIPLPGSMV